ncbi:MAG TPA: response regulator transcription factor [Candidatus Binatus sp.]|nr:response regulator transcription factor [Candidatus Binatus sp.]
MATGTPTARRSPAIRVMLVDDHALLRSAVRQALTDSGLEMVGEVATAEEALRIAPEVMPDVLLVDIDLPGMDGVRLVRELAPRLPETRIVMLTVSTSDHDLLAAMRYGAKGFLTKDLSPDALVRAVRSAHDGELAMPRRLAARLVDRLFEGPARGGRGIDDEALASLSAREREVLGLLAAGLTDRQIGEALVISPRTVETHVGSILHKLGARNRGAAALLHRDAG